MIEQRRNQLIGLEVLWWFITALIVVSVLFPIWQNVPRYPFWLTNILFIVVFITFSRLILLMKYSLIANQKMVKVAITLIIVPIVFLLISQLNVFRTFLDEKGPEAVVGSYINGQLDGLVRYIKNEMLFFGTGSIITAILLPFRLVISVWRNYNRGTA